MLRAKKYSLAAGVILLFVVGCYPFKSIDVPAWKLRVVNEEEIPYSDVSVTQAWKNYTLEAEPGQNSDTRVTNYAGYVEFPERTTRVSFWNRIIRTVYSGQATVTSEHKPVTTKVITLNLCSLLPETITSFAFDPESVSGAP